MSEERGVKDVAKDRLESVGIILNPEKRSGMFLQVDQSTAFASPLYEGVEVMSIRDALKKYEWVSDLMWSLVERKQDEYTREADSEDVNGYFIRAMPGAKIEMPVEACLYLKTLGHKQRVHNIIIAEEGSELNIISGCTSHPGVVSGMHIGISEFFVKKDAKVSFTMVHGWERDMEIRPRSAAKVEENPRQPAQARTPGPSAPWAMGCGTQPQRGERSTGESPRTAASSERERGENQRENRRPSRPR